MKKRTFYLSVFMPGFILTLRYLFHVSGFFYYFSATINPILYNVMSLKYRCRNTNAIFESSFLGFESFGTFQKVFAFMDFL